MLGSGHSHQLLTQFEPLIHHTVRRLGFTPIHAYYQDFCQECRLHLLTLSDQFDGQPLGADRYAFTAYAKRGLTWHLTNFLRSQHPDRELSLEEIEQTANQLTLATSESSYSLTKLLTDMEDQLPEESYALLTLLLSSDANTQELATLFQVSERTIRYRKNRLKDHVKDWISRQP
ncbi:sigma-70 family RNA polymerase sigma factor [Aerococcaceae bacterium DSM 111020]|nr:sigma-70 family RNA polymerase sigma factor [Aerococcaceae bacterium DSM 111020]